MFNFMMYKVYLNQALQTRHGLLKKFGVREKSKCFYKQRFV